MNSLNQIGSKSVPVNITLVIFAIGLLATSIATAAGNLGVVVESLAWYSTPVARLAVFVPYATLWALMFVGAIFLGVRACCAARQICQGRNPHCFLTII